MGTRTSKVRAQRWRVCVVGLPRPEADEHLELAVLADVPGGVVDGTHETAEVAHSGLPVLIWSHFPLLGTFKVDLRLFCEEEKEKKKKKISLHD